MFIRPNVSCSSRYMIYEEAARRTDLAQELTTVWSQQQHVLSLTLRWPRHIHASPGYPPQTLRPRPKHTDYQQSQAKASAALFIWKTRGTWSLCGEGKQRWWRRRNHISHKALVLCQSDRRWLWDEAAGMSSDPSRTRRLCFPNLTAENRVTGNTIGNRSVSVSKQQHGLYVGEEQGRKEKRKDR